MSIFITLIAALIVFSAVIAIHEFGHFAVAKLCGVRVNEFSIGMGPALWITFTTAPSTACVHSRWAAMWRWKGRKAPRASRPKPPATNGKQRTKTLSRRSSAPASL